MTAIATQAATADDNNPVPVAVIVTFTGGFLDAFTYVGHGGVFANSMTGNVVLLGVFSAAADWRQVLNHIPPLVSFIVGIYLVHQAHVSKYEKNFLRFAGIMLLVEILCLLAIALLPASFPDNIIVPAIAFVASVQYESFARIGNYNYSSVTSTVNMKRLAEAIYDHRVTRTPETGKRLRLFGLLSLAFIAGALAGAVSTRNMANASLCIPVILLTVVVLLTARQLANPH
jgi:uncharacterized membrane protein YoaK (UPF0700 family)